MPFVQFAPAYSHFAQADPVVDFLAAALGVEPTPKSKPAACQQRGSCEPRRPVHKRVINPHFDVAELENEYVLEGELPGVSDKSSLSITFDDAQTIVIKGEIKRSSRTAAPQQEQQQLTEAALLQASAAAEPQPEKAVEGTPKRHSVTIEDEVDESETGSNASNDFEVVDGPAPSKADKGKAKATEPADVEMTEAKPVAETKPTAPSAKYWISERPIGVFERRFAFQGLIDQDNVKAHLENGLLTIVVPKRQPYVRQVQIN
jgi:HSP20 family molecular chaperone IbpA